MLMDTRNELNYPLNIIPAENPSAPPLDPAYPWLSRFSNVPRELTDDVNSGQQELNRLGMQAHEARVCLVLDVSASMQNPNRFFEDEMKGNQVQKLINKALALAFLFDDNQKIEVFPFGDLAFPPIVLDRSNFMEATQLIMKSIGGELRNSTNYAEPVKALRRYYFNDSSLRTMPLPCHETPVFAMFITDGEPNEKKMEAMNEFVSASHLAMFFKFIALRGNQKDLNFTYLNNIDNHAVKEEGDARSDLFYLDNSDLVVLDHPGELTMEKLIHEYRPWLCEAQRRKLLTHDQGVQLTNVSDEGRMTSRSSHNPSAFFNKSKNNKVQEKIKHQKNCCLII